MKDSTHDHILEGQYISKENRVDDIRETIRHKTPDQYGSHIPTT
jgi:hypothetical protein